MRFSTLTKGLCRLATKNYLRKTGDRQETDIHFYQAFAEILKTSAVKNALREIRLSLGDRTGSVLDWVCGTGRTHDFTKREVWFICGNEDYFVST
jgi:hypothetical protein